MADRYTFDQDFDGVYLYDIYTDTLTGKKYGVMYEDTLDLLNSQAAEIERLTMEGISQNIIAELDKLRQIRREESQKELDLYSAIEAKRLFEELGIPESVSQKAFGAANDKMREIMKREILEG